MLKMTERKKIRNIVGLMSGTSVDGIDGAVVEICGDPYDGNLRLLAFENNPFPGPVKEKIFELFQTQKATIDKVGYLNVLLGELYARAAASVVEKAGLTMGDIDCIGSHGQTIYHHPQAVEMDGYPVRYTIQLGDGAVIADRTKVPCVSDFRAADMAAGGQGAPLVPFTEYVLYRRKDRTVLLQNLGGIGNITVLPSGCSIEGVYAFDTGPGNMILDGLVSRFTNKGKAMDKGGRIAGRGRVCQELLHEMSSNPYFIEKPPKSTGRELFGDDYIDRLYKKMKETGLSFEDALATATDFTAWSIEVSYIRFIEPKDQADCLVIGGGGSYNPVLVSMIRKRMEKHGVEVMIQENLGFNSDAKEAVAFALLADCCMEGKYNNVPSVTGAERPVILGKISLV